jgi:quercetin dioxygenase-like cupin family protein
MNNQPCEIKYLDGQVRKWTLPVFEGAPSGDVERLKRLLLPQGELAQVYDGPEGIQYIAMAELRADAVRGNHYHKIKQEWLYIFAGAVRLSVAELNLRVRETLTLQAGDLVFIPAGIAHAIRTIHPGQALEFAQARFDAADVYRFVLEP